MTQEDKSTPPSTEPNLKNPLRAVALWVLLPLALILSLQVSGVMERFDGWLSSQTTKTVPHHPVRLSSAAVPVSAPAVSPLPPASARSAELTPSP